MAEKYYASLDIGDTLTKLIIGIVYNKKLHLCAKYCLPTTGVKNGEVVSKVELQSTLASLFEMADHDGFPVKEVVLVFPAHSLNVKRKIAYVRPQGAYFIDSDRLALEKACANHNLMEHEVAVDLYPVKYTYDNVEVPMAPIGRQCRQVSIEAYVVSMPIANKIYFEILDGMGIEVIDYPINPVANAVLVLKEQEFQDGAFILDLSAQHYVLSFMYKKTICSIRQSEYGIDTIINEVARAYDMEYSEAYDLVMEYGNASIARSNNFVITTLQDGHEVTESDLTSIIDNALNLILADVRRSFEKILNDIPNDIPVILTGGGCMLPYIGEKFSQALEMRCEVRFFDKIGGQDSCYNASIGGLASCLLDKSLIDGSGI